MNDIVTTVSRHGIRVGQFDFTSPLLAIGDTVRVKLEASSIKIACYALDGSFITEALNREMLWLNRAIERTCQ
jgi:hypothetical protein